MTDTPGTLEERLREAAADERVYAKEQDFWHEELLTEAADEIARLYSLARANNDLARRYADEIASLRARVEVMTGALVDLMSWFPEKPSDPEWRIKGGEFGADEAVEHARSLVEKEPTT